MTDTPLPVILISFNRGRMLRKVIDGYRRQSVPTDIFVHDNGSTDPETIAALARLEKEGIAVFRRPAISTLRELDLVDESVRQIFATRAPSPYAVSDCDVSLADSSPSTLEIYRSVLEAMPDIECAGPMLRIDDVPQSYPMYNAVMNRQISLFWSREPSWLALGGKRVAYQRTRVDTTLAVHRAGAPFKRMRRGVRLYHPYDARHLDWYPHEQDDGYRASTEGSPISNWSNPARERALRRVALQQIEFRSVTEGPDGELVAVTRRVATRRR